MKYIVLVAALLFTGCSYAMPDAGVEGVIVRKPFVFGHGGIDEAPIKTGSSVVAWSTQVVYVNMQPQQVGVEFDDLMTRDGVPLDFHAAIQYRITDSVKLVRDFGGDIGPAPFNTPGFFSRNLEQSFRAQVRDSVKQHGLNEMAIDTTAAAAVDADVTEKFLALVTATKVPIVLLGITLGRANPPDAIKHQRIATAEQEQRQQTERQAKLAEDQRKMHEESRAAADNAYRSAMSLSPDQFLRLETIKMQRDVCAAGKCTFLVGGGAVPTIEVSR